MLIGNRVWGEACSCFMEKVVSWVRPSPGRSRAASCTARHHQPLPTPQEIRALFNPKQEFRGPKGVCRIAQDTAYRSRLCYAELFSGMVTGGANYGRRRRQTGVPASCFLVVRHKARAIGSVKSGFVLSLEMHEARRGALARWGLVSARQPVLKALAQNQPSL